MRSGAEYELIASPMEEAVANLVRQATDSIFICSPYIKGYGADIILKNARVRDVHLLTSLDLTSVTNGSLSLDAILRLWKRFQLKVSSLGKLHAKIYMADDRHAIITSANLTRGGLKENYEYGIVLHNALLVKGMRMDMQRYFSLGNIFEREAIEQIAEEADEIKALQKKVQGTPEARTLRKAFRAKEEHLQTALLQNRVVGRTINAIFADTIQYLLDTKGPLSTAELHPLIQDIHPDICDDSIDRVINGQHFGKKWKHQVRNAQLTLKLQGKIALQDGKWVLLENDKGI